MIAQNPIESATAILWGLLRDYAVKEMHLELERRWEGVGGGRDDAMSTIGQAASLLPLLLRCC